MTCPGLALLQKGLCQLHSVSQLLAQGLDRIWMEEESSDGITVHTRLPRAQDGEKI